MATLAEISSRLERGYFLKEDMETLGLSGPVSVAQMRAEVGSLLKQPEPQAVLDVNIAQRAAQARAAVAREAQEQADRDALIASIAEKQEEAKQEVLKQNEANEIAERFKEALKQDPNVVQTP
jgi:hypothetical protein